MLAVAYGLGLDRVLLNLDYFVCCILLAYQYKKMVLPLLAVCWLSDALLLLRQVFPFFRLDEVLFILKFVFLSSSAYLILLLISSIIFLLILWCYLQIKLSLKISVYVFFGVVLLFTIETSYRTATLQENKWVDSQITHFIERQFWGFNQSLRAPSEKLVNIPFSFTTQNLFNNIDANQKISSKILFIVNESLGSPKNLRVQQAILAPLIAMKNKKEFSINHYSYQMPTVYGELRELCHAQPRNLNLRDLKDGFNDCLPNKLKDLGYHTVSLHSAIGSMYDRKDWYPKAGFNQNIFFETKQWKNKCYSFPGACDIEIIDMLDKEIKKEKLFFYWLTLNSHAPYDLKDLYIDIFDCQKYDIENDSMSCRNLKLQAQFFYILAKKLNNPLFKGVEVYIVGDHTPVIFDQTEKKENFNKNNVLSIRFKMMD